jgi:hypothetical protein
MLRAVVAATRPEIASDMEYWLGPPFLRVEQILTARKPKRTREPTTPVQSAPRAAAINEQRCGDAASRKPSCCRRHAVCSGHLFLDPSPAATESMKRTTSKNYPCESLGGTLKSPPLPAVQWRR